MINSIYILPSKAKRMKDRRESKKKSTPAKGAPKKKKKQSSARKMYGNLTLQLVRSIQTRSG
jgi:hypothetical protein